MLWEIEKDLFWKNYTTSIIYNHGKKCYVIFGKRKDGSETEPGKDKLCLQ